MSDDLPERVVEMGTGQNPYVELLREDLVNPNAQVLVVDRHSVSAIKDARQVVLHDVVGVKADISKKFLADNSVDVVFAKDVLSDPKTQDREQMLRNWYAAVKVGGKLVIYENGTPTHYEDVDKYASKTKQLLQDAGWEIQEEHVGTSSDQVLRITGDAGRDTIAFVAIKRSPVGE